MRKWYGSIEDTTLKNVLKSLDARADVVLYVLRSHSNTFKDVENENDSKLVFKGSVYQLFDETDLLEYDVEYLNFGYERVVIIIKPKSWMEDAKI